jgi:hypothetical protein
VLRLHLLRRADAAPGQVRDVPVEVAPVGRQGVAGEPALDLEVLEVPAQVPPDRLGRVRRRPGRGWGRGRGQASTSASATDPSPCASATGAFVSCPAWVFSPSASDGSSRQASTHPLFATRTTYGSVALVRA